VRKNFVIARIDRAAGVFMPVFCIDEDARHFRKAWPLEKGLSGYVASGAGQSFIFEDGVTPIPEGYPMLGRRPSFWLGVPIRLGSLLMGVVITQSYDPEEGITREDERMLEDICPHIAGAIARTELFSSVRILKK